MNPATKLIALFIRDLMGYNESLIKIGRLNEDQDDFNTAYVVVDSLGQASRESRLESYDGSTEEIKYGTIWQAPVTIDFYASGAYSRASEFQLRMRTDAASDLRKSLQINILQVSGLIDVKQLTGQQYGERIQLSLVVEYNQEIAISALSIDTAQFEFYQD